VFNIKRVAAPFASASVPRLSRSERSRQDLLRAARTVFSREGLERASVREIVRLARQNDASIQYHFGGKENLYRAVLAEIVQDLRANMGSVLQEVAALGAQPRPSRAAALTLLQRFISNLFLNFLSRDDIASIGRLIVREQTQPTAGFDILYEQAFRPVHEGLCRLTAIVIGRDPGDIEVIVRTHAMMGQAHFFAMSRETILRRAGWKTLEGENARYVAGLLSEHIAILLRGVRTRRGQPQVARRPAVSTSKDL
jgi:AcrR family transcriptional regulator